MFPVFHFLRRAGRSPIDRDLLAASRLLLRAYRKLKSLDPELKDMELEMDIDHFIHKNRIRRLFHNWKHVYRGLR